MAVQGDQKADLQIAALEKKGGGVRSYSDDQRKHAREFLNKGESPLAVAKLLNVCRATLCNS